MRHIKIITPILILWFSAAVSAGNAISLTSKIAPEYIPGEIIVKFRPSVNLIKPKPAEFSVLLKADSKETLVTTDDPSINSLLKKIKTTEMNKLLNVMGKAADFSLHVQRVKSKYHVRYERTSKDAKIPELSNIYKIVIPADADIELALKALRSVPNVEYAEPNYKRHIFVVPNDPYYGSSGSWGQGYNDMWWLHKIEAAQAWDINTGSDEVKIAVIDTGVDYNHADLAENVWVNSDEIPGNGIDDDSNGYVDDNKGWDFAYHNNNPMDDYGHGTHVSGIAAAKGNNGIGVVGVTWNCKIMAVKGLDDGGYGSDSELAEAIIYAADNGADVINMSWGGQGSSQTIADAIAYASGVGCVLVAAAGNSNEDVTNYYPASLPEVITVASTNHFDGKSDFSNWGAKIDVAAPGGDDVYRLGYDYAFNLLSLKSSNLDSSMQSYVVGGSYLRLAGTSMAAPCVSGVAALIISEAPTYGQEQIKQVIRTSADDLGEQGWDPYFGYGRVNAYRALLASTLGIMGYISSPEGGAAVPPTVQIRGRASGPNFQGYKVEYGAGASPATWEEIANSTTEVNDGILCTWDDSALSSGNYTLKLTVFNLAGGSCEASTGVIVAGTIISANSGLWSDVATWQGGRVPTRYDSVVISSGHEVVFDQNDSSTTCRTVTINSGGKLRFGATPADPKTMLVKGDIQIYGTLELVAGSILKLESEAATKYGVIVYAGGELKGTGSIPTAMTTLTSPLEIGAQTITVASIAGFGIGDRITVGEGASAEGFVVASISGGQLTLNKKALNGQLSGSKVYKDATITTSAVSSGGKSFTVADLGGIKAGDRLAIAASSNYQETEIRTVESAASNSITLTQPLTYSHFSGALVVKLNRDTLITSAVQDGTQNSYLQVDESGSLRLDCVEIGFMGSSDTDANKLGIIIKSSGPAAPLARCSIHNGYYGIGIANCKMAFISNVLALNGIGIYSGYDLPNTADGSRIISNIAFSNNSYGMRLTGYYSNLFLSNNIAYSNDCGIYFANYDCVILNNDLLFNPVWGGLSAGGGNTIIAGNLFARNNAGLCSYGSIGDILLDNDFNENEHSLWIYSNWDNLFEYADCRFTNNDYFMFDDGSYDTAAKLIFKHCDFSPQPQVDINIKTSKLTDYMLFQNCGGLKGTTRICGDYRILDGKTAKFNYADRSYTSHASKPVLFYGSNHKITTPETEDSSTTAEVWFVTYHSLDDKWEVKGTVSGLQAGKATSGVDYVSDSGQVSFTLSQEAGVQEGDQFVFATIAAANDQNTQKKILFEPSSIPGLPELNSQSWIMVDTGATIEVRGTADYPTLLDHNGTGGYGFIIDGAIDARYFNINSINKNGVWFEPGSTIISFDNGNIQNVYGLGPHLYVDNMNHTFNYLNFDATGAYDVKAVDANLIFKKSQRGKYSDLFIGTSSIDWEDPVLGFSTDNLLGACTVDAGGLVAVPFKIKDPNQLVCNFKAGSAQYNVNDSGWKTIPDSSISGISGTYESATTFESAPVDYIYWSSGDQLGSTFESNDVKFRFRIYNGYDYSNYGSSESFVIDQIPPSIVIVEPNGGNYWKGGSTRDIIWTATDEGCGVKDNSISIYYSTGESFVLIASNEANDGSYSWTLPSIDSSAAKIRLTAADNQDHLGSRESESAFFIDSSPPSVDLISPEGEELWMGGSLHNITWTAGDNYGLADNPISIYYSTGEGDVLIAGNELNDGVYSWLVPKEDSNSVKVKIIASDKAGNTNSDESTSVLVICVPPSVTLLTPAGGEKIAGGSIFDITWIASDEGSGLAPAPITIAYSTNSGGSWNIFAENEPNDGAFSWNVPALDSSSVRIIVQAKDLMENNGSDQSGNFTVDSLPPSVALIYPNGAEILKGGANIGISWAASDEGSGIADNSIALYYSTGEGEVLIAGNLPNSGTYNWIIPSIDTTEARIKITAQDNVSKIGSDESDNVFAIDSTPPDAPTISAVKSPTVVNYQIISGTKSNDSTVIQVNGSAGGVSFPSSTTWSKRVSLSKGENSISVRAKDAAGNESGSVTAKIDGVDRTFTDAGMQASVQILFGAVTEEVESIIFERVALPSAPMHGAESTGQAFKLSCSTDGFTQPLTITLPKPEVEGELRCYRWDEIQGKWIRISPLTQTTSSLAFDSSRLGIFTVFKIIDFSGPSVDSFVINGRNVSNGDSITSKPQLQVNLSDNYGADTSETTVSVDGTALGSSSGLRASQVGAAASVSYIFGDSEELSLGSHVFRVTAADEVGNVSSWEATLFVVGSSINGLLIYPNPYKLGDPSNIKFDGLTEDIKVYIYDISGDLVWTGQNTAGSASLTWKVVNSAGNQLVPGVYLYVVTTASGGKQSGKIAIVR